MPPGVSFLLIGSGLYWVLSSQLISSFTVLSPELFQSTTFGQTLIKIVGIVCLAAGLWTVNIDLDEFCSLADGPVGYVYALPIMLVALDLFSTLVRLSLSSGTIELNPFVASAIRYGFSAIVPYLVSYLALSQGLTLLMLRTGRWLFGESNWMQILPFALVCGVSSFGPFSNILGMAFTYSGFVVYVIAGLGSGLLTFAISKTLRTAIALRPPL